MSRSPGRALVPPVVAFGAAFAMTVLGGGACGSSSSATDGNPSADAASACKACVTDDDCSGDLCVQVGGDSYCLPACNGGSCAADRACTPEVTVDGRQVEVCLARASGCGESSTPPTTTLPGDARCGALVGPDVKSTCASCRSGTCQANGCFGGWWCNTTTSHCQAPPTSCATGDGGAGSRVDAGGTVEGTVGPNGGKISRLFFAVVGDTRPPVIDDTSGYPTAVITSIYDAIATTSPMPAFVVASGDYLFARATGTQAAPQLDKYLAARARYPGTVFPALGNHECTGATTSNCGAGNVDGVTNNYAAFTAKLLAPIGRTTPNYEVDVSATDGSWTAKVLFVAGNAWTTSDATWLDGAMSKPTTYTFVVRHEPKAVTDAPGVRPSEEIMAAHPYTLAIVGHTHTYGRTGPRQITVGNGGAPLVGPGGYGFALLDQRKDGAITVNMIDVATGQADPSFAFALRPDGSAAP